ncbi:MAG: hypothetical protein UW68_C0008G0004 [Candidatus Collierbacteria bacterium GW2011_GWB1_44_6]|uniref:Uncharacterized protein n=1 Tax=Candidatus Collierbacteria bacterium GW2011_GWB1_44_6 TaxID=1618384 RepID=A0A0G1JQ07_9BACT|nr:MAG: hypothetical protein UW68_C0008G0004 [Candidatus Collierbacteria bacterium GW2011_GWB1_44_6]KKT83855.1 MAG: hypothetical protein UW80_C0005G0003 [Microgenomates group bacterium GW2011_GWC1_44_9]
MCCGGYFGCVPSPLGIFISQQTPGTEIIILSGEGMPPVQTDSVDIIWKVDENGFSALTAKGVVISCKFNSDLTLTGRHHEEGTYDVSEEAKETMRLVEELQAEEDRLFAEFPEDDTDTPDWTVPPPFSSEPE